MPGPEHLMSFHFVMAGSGWIEAADLGLPPARIERGDVILMPGGDSHFLSSEPGVQVPPRLADYYRPTDRSLPFQVIVDGSGPDTIRIVCGYFGCDAAPFNPLLEALPRLAIIKAKPHCMELASSIVGRPSLKAIAIVQAARPFCQSSAN